MTREDAKDYIREWCPYDRQEEIIKALEQEPCIQEKQANANKIDAVYIDGFKAGYSQARFDLEQEPLCDRLAREYISKVKYCDECFASTFCTINGLRNSRVPQSYCIENIKKYFESFKIGGA